MKTHPTFRFCYAAALVAAVLIASATNMSGQITSAANAVTQMGSPINPIGDGLKKTTLQTIPTNYVLKADDEVQIRVFRNPELDGPRRISRDGTIDFPLLGIVKL